MRGADLAAPFRRGIDELRITFEPHSLEDMTRIWTGLQDPYRLSVAYHVQVVRIDSPVDALQVPPVEERPLGVGQALVEA